MRELFNYLSALGSRKNLNFSNFEFLKGAVVGLDTTNRTLLIIQGIQEAKYEEVLISLDEVKSCSLKRVYGSIKAGDLKRRKLEQLLDKVSLHFEFRSDRDPVELPFFEYSGDDVSKRSELNQKAREWGEMLSEMLKASAQEMVSSEVVNGQW